MTYPVDGHGVVFLPMCEGQESRAVCIQGTYIVDELRGRIFG